MIKEGNTKYQRKFSLSECVHSHWEIANIKTNLFLWYLLLVIAVGKWSGSNPTFVKLCFVRFIYIDNEFKKILTVSLH